MADLAVLRRRIQEGYFDFHGGSGDPDEALLLSVVDAVEAAQDFITNAIDASADVALEGRRRLFDALLRLEALPDE